MSEPTRGTRSIKILIAVVMGLAIAAFFWFDLRSYLALETVKTNRDRLLAWVTETRNVYEDYKRAFGKDPPMISGVAIMTDTDNTGESATAHYGDIVFKHPS